MVLLITIQAMQHINSTFSIACSWNPLIREVSDLNESYNDNLIIDRFIETEPIGEDDAVDVVETIGNTYSILLVADDGDYVELKKSIDMLEVFSVKFIGDIDNDQKYEVVVKTDHIDFIHIEGLAFASYTIFDNDFESLGDLWVYAF